MLKDRKGVGVFAATGDDDDGPLSEGDGEGVVDLWKVNEDGC